MAVARFGCHGGRRRRSPVRAVARRGWIDVVARAPAQRRRAHHARARRRGRDLAETNVRTRVHEYGGGAWLLHGDTAFFSSTPTSGCTAWTRAPSRARSPRSRPSPSSIRYADGRVTPDGAADRHVRETHGEDDEPVNELVAVPADGDGRAAGARLRPRLLRLPAPQPRRHPGCAWTCWDHPNMPWDGTELWVAPLDDPGVPRAWWPAARASRSGSPSGAPTAGSTACPTGTGWWNLYREGEQAHRRAGGARLPAVALRRIHLRLPRRRLDRVRRGCRARWSAWACCAPARVAARGPRPSLHAVGYPYVQALGEPGGAAWPRARPRRRPWSPGARRTARAWCGAPASSRSTPGWAPVPRSARVPERGRAHGARALVSADQPRLRRRRTASCRRCIVQSPWRAHRPRDRRCSTSRSCSGRAAGSAWWT